MPVEVNSPFWPLGAGKATWAGVKAKQLEFRLLVRSLSDRGRPGKNGLLGAKPDTKLAVQLNRTRLDVYWRRMKLGIRPAVERPPQRNWKPDEDRLLETASDAVFGRKLGRSVSSVQLRRLRLGLRSHGNG